jgi:hypothetical protein
MHAKGLLLRNMLRRGFWTVVHQANSTRLGSTGQ